MNYNHPGILKLSNKDKKVITDFINLQSVLLQSTDPIDSKINRRFNKTISDLNIRTNYSHFDFSD